MLMTKHFVASIACLSFDKQEQNPGIRLDRIMYIRRKLTSGEYNLTENLDIAADRLLEEILEQQPANKVTITGTQDAQVVAERLFPVK